MLRGFAVHHRAAGMADDHWLPADVYDEERWSVDGLYLYIITDGNVGGPRSPRRKIEDGHAASTLTSCNVCDPKVGSDSDGRKAALAHLAGVLSDASGSEVRPAKTALLTFLIELGLGHLQEFLRDEVLADLATEAAVSRTAFLSRLKQVGVDKLAERQKLTNGLSKAWREGTIASDPSLQ